mgnify:CR=1 FL=1
MLVDCYASLRVCTAIIVMITIICQNYITHFPYGCMLIFFLQVWTKSSVESLTSCIKAAHIHLIIKVSVLSRTNRQHSISVTNYFLRRMCVSSFKYRDKKSKESINGLTSFFGKTKILI